MELEQPNLISAKREMDAWAMRIFIADAFRKAKAMGRECGVPLATVYADFIEGLSRKKGIRLSRATLCNWERYLRLDGPLGLRDLRASSNRASFEDRAYWNFFAELRRLYAGPGLLSIEGCFWLCRDKAIKQGWKVPMFRQAARYIRRHVLPQLTRERGAAGRLDSR